MFKYLAAIFLMTAAAASAQSLTLQDKLALRDNCKQDVQKLCPGIKPGDVKLMGCIKEKKNQLSAVCSATVSELMAKREN